MKIGGGGVIYDPFRPNTTFHLRSPPCSTPSTSTPPPPYVRHVSSVCNCTFFHSPRPQCGLEGQCRVLCQTKMISVECAIDVCRMANIGGNNQLVTSTISTTPGMCQHPFGYATPYFCCALSGRFKLMILGVLGYSGVFQVLILDLYKY